METLERQFNQMKVNVDPNTLITEDMLSEVIQQMKRQRLSGISLSELVTSLVNISLIDGNRSSASPEKKEPPTPSDFDKSSFVFDFRSPLQKFQFEPKIANEIPKYSTTTSQPEDKKVSPKKSKTESSSFSKFEGFYETARNSIPGDIQSPVTFAKFGLDPTADFGESVTNSPFMQDARTKGSQTKSNKSNEFPSLFKSNSQNATPVKTGNANEGKSFPSLFQTNSADANQNTDFQFFHGDDFNFPKFETGSDGSKDKGKGKYFKNLSTNINSNQSSSNTSKDTNQFKFTFNGSFYEESRKNSDERTQESFGQENENFDDSNAPRLGTNLVPDDDSDNEDENIPAKYRNPLDKSQMSVDENVPPSDDNTSKPNGTDIGKDDTFPTFANNTNLEEDFDSFAAKFAGFNIGSQEPNHSHGKKSHSRTSSRPHSAHHSPTSSVESKTKPFIFFGPSGSSPNVSEPTQATTDSASSNKPFMATDGTQTKDEPEIPKFDIGSNLGGYGSNKHYSKKNSSKRNKDGSKIKTSVDDSESIRGSQDSYSNTTQQPSVPPMFQEPVSATAAPPQFYANNPNVENISPRPMTSESDAPPSWWSNPKDFDENNKQYDGEEDSEDAEEGEEEDHQQFQSKQHSESPNRQSGSSPRAADYAPNMRTESADTQGSNSSEKSLLAVAEMYNKQGKEFYNTGMYDSALDAYTKCLDMSPKTWAARATILGNRAAVYFMLGKYIECVNDCEDALSMDPTLVKLQIRKGKSLIKLGHLVPAETVFRSLLTNQFDHLNHIRSSFDKVLEGVKMEAKAGLRELEKLKNTIETLVSHESKLEFAEVLKIADTILRVSPNHRVVQIAKANALNQLNKFEESKEYIEKLTLNMSLTIAVLYAHPQAKFPLPTITSLEWKESTKVANTIDVDIRAVSNIFLCIGFELGTHYLMALKNLSISRSASADVMTKIKTILTEVDKTLQSGDKEEAWGWIPKELTKINELLSVKITADHQFKSKNFAAALTSYTHALKIDYTAKIWNAILYSNRAATEMSLGLYADAVTDCHNAINKDPEYSRAYLRRARAYRAMSKFNESVRDYRRYLCFDPIPSDFKDIQKELEEMIDQKATEEREAFKQKTNASRPQSARNNNNNSDRQSFDYDAYFGDNRKGKPSNFFYPNQHQNNSSRPSSAKFSPRTGYNANSNNAYQHQTNQSQKKYNNNYEKYFEFHDDDDDDDDEPPPSSSYKSNTNNRTDSNAQAGGSTKAAGIFSLKETDHYTVLGIDVAASEREIKMAYRKLALQFHPDKNKDEGAEDRFKMIALAYNVLSDKTTRRQYDLTRPVSDYRNRRR